MGSSESRLFWRMASIKHELCRKILLLPWAWLLPYQFQKNQFPKGLGQALLGRRSLPQLGKIPPLHFLGITVGMSCAQGAVLGRHCVLDPTALRTAGSPRRCVATLEGRDVREKLNLDGGPRAAPLHQCQLKRCVRPCTTC